MPDTTAITTAVKDDAIESVMVVKKLANQESTRYVPGYVSTEPVTRYNPWTRAYETWYRDVQHAGYTDTEKTVRHKIALWLTRGSAQLAWIGVGEVIDPNSPEAVRREVVDLVVPELVQQHLIPPK